MDLIQLLKDKVSPIVMHNEHSYIVEKHQALNQFYPFLLSVLQAKPEVLTQLKNQLGDQLSTLFSHRPELKQDLIMHLQPDVPADEVEDVLNKAIPPALNVLEGQAGSSEPAAIQHLLQNAEHQTILGLSPSLAAILAALGISTSAPRPQTHSTQVPYHHVPEKEGIAWWKILLGLIILGLLLMLLMRACSNQDDNQNHALVENESAYVTARTNDQGELAECEIAAGNQSLMGSMQSAIQRAFNSNLNCNEIANGRYSASFIDVDAMPSVLAFIKDQPNSSLRWSGDQLNLDIGQAVDVNALQTQLQALVPNMSVHVRQTAFAAVDEAKAVEQSIAATRERLNSLDVSKLTALDLATALNLQIINFASASAEIPDENKSILQQAAEIMKQIPAVKLSVNGHTDATGDAQMNKALSLQRAQSVVDYLIGQGVNQD